MLTVVLQCRLWRGQETGHNVRILLTNSLLAHLHPELKLRAQPTKAAEAAWEPGLPGFVVSARRFIVA